MAILQANAAAVHAIGFFDCSELEPVAPAVLAVLICL